MHVKEVKFSLWISKHHAMNFYPLLNEAPRHEGILGEWRYGSTHSWPRQYTKVGGQLYVPAALPPG
jgi:hypothetical protein